LIRLVAMLAIEANDEWLVGWARVLRESMATQHGRSNRDTTSHLEGRARER
jgi:hypothetical protein